MLVALFGTGRNGSTLLGRLLDGSPDLWVHPVEVNCLSAFSDLARFGAIRPETNQNATTEPLLADARLPLEQLVGFYEHQLHEVSEDYLGGAAVTARPLRLEGDVSATDLLPRVLEAIRVDHDERPTVPVTLFKTIETPYVDDYAHAFPEMRFIHLVRDPVATYSSLKRTNRLRKQWPFWWHGGDEMRMLLEKRWIPHARFVTERAPLDPGRHVVVRYEDIVAAPAQSVERLCAWLGAAPPPEPDLQTVLGGRQMARLPVNSSAPGVETPARVISDMESRFAYDDVVTPRERDFIRARTARLAEQLGYDGWHGSRTLSALRWLLPDRSEIANATSARRTAVAILARRRYIYGSLLHR